MPGEPVDYIVQPGDTVSALASRFNTTQSEILKANPIIPAVTTTLPPRMPMKIPIYYRSHGEVRSKFFRIPFLQTVRLKSVFSARSFVDRQPGWFKFYGFIPVNKTGAVERLLIISRRLTVSVRVYY
jgi:hypothetical protein